MDIEFFDGFRAVVGYQKPKVECHDVEDDESLHHFLQNDAVIAGLDIELSDFLDTNQKEKLGRAVSNSDHLRELQIWGTLGPNEIALEPFFIWLAHNRSIEIFRLNRVAISDQDNFAVLAPFFEKNCKLRCIELRDANVSRCIPALTSALSKSKLNRLARIDLCAGAIGDKKASDLIETINAMSGLPNLLDLWLSGNKIRKGGCVALGELLKNPECNILSLDLSFNLFDDECIGILVDGFVERDTLKSLSISNQQRLTAAGWKILSNFLSGSKCKLEKLILHQTNVAEDSATFLGYSLAMNETLKCLDFCHNDISSTGWRGISNCLAPTSTISELNLDESNIDDEAAFVLFSALAINATLKTLVLFSRHITSAGWVLCFRQLVDSRSALVNIEFGWHIDDEGVAALSNLVIGHINTISSLSLYGNSRVSANGWSAFASILAPSSTSQLKTLRVGDSQDEITGSYPITKDVIFDLVTALAGNSTLELLELNDVGDDVELALEALVTVLCDATSLDSVCRSNHTLHEFVCYCSEDTVYPSDFHSLLEMNDDEDKAQVVRTKLLTYFFSDVGNIGPVFGRMATTILPNAIEWIGRDLLGYSAMFEFCRSMPVLFK
jgi:hypothetical protein